MRIAVTTEGNQVFQHFGHCKEFTIFEIEDQKVVQKSTLDTSASGHGALADLMKENKVDVLICGGIGGGARRALKANRVEIVPGVTGEIEEVVVRYLSGEQIGDPDFICTHHSEGGEHHCGSHGEGEEHHCHC